MRKIKIGKILVVIFLTCLIWAWADLSKTEEVGFSNAIINIDKTATPGLWVSFDNEPSVLINKIMLKGTASKIADLERKIREGSESLEFFLDAKQEAMTDSGKHLLDILRFLKKSSKIKQLGLTVESCEPETLDVQVIKLEKKSLTIKCIDENGATIKTESIEPPKINMLAREDWSGEQLVAYVLLSRADREQARQIAVSKTPYIKLAPGQTRNSNIPVKVKLPPTEKGLQEYNITSATIGFVFSANLVGKYDVELLNPADVATVNIKATAAAKKAYEDQPYQIILHILDEDKKDPGEKRKKVVYNFPEEFFRKNEIRLEGEPKEARFKLRPLSLAEPPPAGTN